MSLLKTTVRDIFDVDKIHKGVVVHAKHKSWPVGRNGLVTGGSEYNLTVQYISEAGCAVNYFMIDARETAEGEWDIRWSDDLIDIGVLNGGDET